MVSELTEEILIPPALKSKAAAGALLNRDGDRRPGAAATKFPLNALTGHVLASPEIYCASRLHSQEEYAPCHADPAPAAGGPPSVGKLISVTGESLARSMQIRSGPLRQRKQRAARSPSRRVKTRSESERTTWACLCFGQAALERPALTPRTNPAAFSARLPSDWALETSCSAVAQRRRLLARSPGADPREVRGSRTALPSVSVFNRWLWTQIKSVGRRGQGG